MRLSALRIDDIELLQQGLLKVNTSGCQIRISIEEKFLLICIDHFANDSKKIIITILVCKGTGKDLCNQKQNPNKNAFQ